MKKEKKSANSLSLEERLNAPTPSFFKKIRNAGMILTAIAGVLAAAPVAIPAGIVGYIATAGLVASAIAQTTVDEEKIEK